VDSSGLRWDPVTGTCERINEPLGSIIDDEFFD
jgi:hypothetical protein